MPDPRPITIHLIANAHIDPVWLWDWREGLNEAWQTCQTIASLMEEREQLTFIRGEAAIYEHIRRYDPSLFIRITRLIEQGRWELVGGTWVQPDTNLASTETYCRHFLHGQRYFQEQFGRQVQVAWAADSFGHAAGLPEILAPAGIRYFAFTRPQASMMPMSKPVFWWEGPGGSRLLCYRPAVGWYGSDRDELPRRFDEVLADARRTGMVNVAMFYGLGNHGGGPTRRSLSDIQRWADEHPDIRVEYSGLHRLFGAIEDEFAGREDEIPFHRGELNFALRGCYASAMRFKSLYFTAEENVVRAETTASLLAAADLLAQPQTGPLWRDLLFNSFHDILPGSSIERASDEQLQWISGTLHRVREVEMAAINALATHVDTSVPSVEDDRPTAVPVLIWNPSHRPYHGPVEVEVSLDYRPIAAYIGRPDEVPVEVLGADGQPCPFQVIPTEHRYMLNMPWRRRVVLDVDLPPWGWSVMTVGHVEQPEMVTPVTSACGANAQTIYNEYYHIEAVSGAKHVDIRINGKRLFDRDGLGFAVYEDPWGSWGGMEEDPDSFHFDQLRYQLTVSRVEIHASGPLRSQMWICFVGDHCRVDLTLTLHAGHGYLNAFARIHWDERSARLKMLLPAGDRVDYQVPGGAIERTPCGEVPGGRYAVIHGPQSSLGFASDVLSSFDAVDSVFRPTICRATRYATDERLGPDELPSIPSVDKGELKIRFALTRDILSLPTIAEQLCRPVIVQTVPATQGQLPRKGTFGGVKPNDLEVLALKHADDDEGYVIRIRNPGHKISTPQLLWMTCELRLDPIAPGRIRTWRLLCNAQKWIARPVDTIETNRPAYNLASKNGIMPVCANPSPTIKTRSTASDVPIG